MISERKPSTPATSRWITAVPLDNGRAAVPPIYASAAFDLGDAARGDALAGGDIDGFEYSRVANPTVDALEKRLAALEDGIGAVAVGSGMAAAY